VELKLTKAETEALVEELFVAYRLEGVRTSEGFLAYLDTAAARRCQMARDNERQARDAANRGKPAIARGRNRHADRLRKAARFSRRLHTKITAHRGL